MLTPSKSDCITVLSAASHIANPAEVVSLDPAALGLTMNQMTTTASFLGERACFLTYRRGVDQCAVGALSLQGRLRLDQLVSD